MNTFNVFKKSLDFFCLVPYHEDMVKINEITEIRTGYNLRGMDDSRQQTVLLVLAKDMVTSFTTVDEANIPETFSNYLRDGDILVKSRGSKYEAKVFKAQNCNHPYVASNTLIVVRLKTNQYNSVYITQIINSDESQQFLRSLSSGQTLPILSPSALGLLECPEIPLEKQKRLEEAVRIMDDYRMCLAQYQKVGEELTKALEQQFTKGVK